MGIKPASRLVVGVVIPVYNDWHGLQKCLRALAAQTHPSSLVRVRVVNNGSDDWPHDPNFPLPVEVIYVSKPGSYAARNRAALNWDVDVLAFTDADCLPAQDWLQQGVEALTVLGLERGLIAGHIELVPQSPASLRLAEQLDQILGFDQSRTVRRARYGVTANLFLSQKQFQSLGGFLSNTRSGGDRDFCQRACAHGLGLTYASSCVVRHPARDWPSLIYKQRRIVGGRLSLASRDVFARLQVLWLSLRPVVSESWRIICVPSIPPLRRLRLLLLVLVLRLNVLFEWLRLQWPGQEPLR